MAPVYGAIVVDSVEQVVHDLLVQMRSGPVDTGWSGLHEDGASLVRDVERLVTPVGNGDPEALARLRLLFAPTGALQEAAMASGWSDAYMELADRLDGLG